MLANNTTTIANKHLKTRLEFRSNTLYCIVERKLYSKYIQFLKDSSELSLPTGCGSCGCMCLKTELTASKTSRCCKNPIYLCAKKLCQVKRKLLLEADIGSTFDGFCCYFLGEICTACSKCKSNGRESCLRGLENEGLITNRLMAVKLKASPTPNPVSLLNYFQFLFFEL